jgi:hypothetical protein
MSRQSPMPPAIATLHYVFPAHSFTQIVVGVERS